MDTMAHVQDRHGILARAMLDSGVVTGNQPRLY